MRRRSVLGFATDDTAAVIRRLDDGLTFQSVLRLRKALGLPLDQLGALIGISQRTLARRRVEGRLLPRESERALRIARVFDLSAALFEQNLASANAWLRAPKRALDGEAPLAFARTEVGAREVESTIGRLEHGALC